MSGLVVLTTDFGLHDEYVGVMKGVIAGLAPVTQVIDLSHGIEPHNIAQAAHLLDSSCRFFPDQTIHVVVVDPGVGSERRLILVGARRQLFLAPDNGVLSLLLGNEDFTFARAVVNDALFIKPVSRTFHGRDILAPVAAQLAAGLDATAVGPELARHELTELPLRPLLAADGQGMDGMVVQVDRFGNLITNIPRAAAQGLGCGTTGIAVSITVGGKTIAGLAACYSEVQTGELLALFGSRDYLEIAINQGNAAKYLGVSAGEIVQLRTFHNFNFTPSITNFKLNT
ncbi:MAG: SAM-dependent chlorinase/fluorinase [Desulfobulbaceae bacterium]|nr:SAM-dependent chlorinase/fluorinase [Desulfobulbaceae bacterium]